MQIVEVKAEGGQRLDNFLLVRMKGLPRSRVYRMVRRGEVRVNGSRSRAGYRVQRGDRIRVPPYRGGDGSGGGETAVPRGAHAALLAAVVYEDDDLVVIDKPSGFAVHGGSGVAFGVVETLRRFDPKTPFELAHRIDRDTSGCLAIAKNRRTLLALHAQFREGKVGKRYEVVVAGRWPAGTRTVEKPLLRYVLASGERRVRVSGSGDRARTDFSVVARLDHATWLAAFPRTGRTHQIRVHAAASGHPILGDDKYGNYGRTRSAPAKGAGAEPNPNTRLMLHASELKLTLGDRPMRFKAPLPPEFDTFRPAGVGIEPTPAGT